MNAFSKAYEKQLLITLTYLNTISISWVIKNVFLAVKMSESAVQNAFKMC